MPLTVEQMVEETRDWPDKQLLVRLEDNLEQRLHAMNPEIEAAGKDEAHHRLEERQSGQLQSIPGDEVSAKFRRIVGR
jgi:hypothetical protein